MNIEIRSSKEVYDKALLISEITKREVKTFEEDLLIDTDILFICIEKVDSLVKKFIENINVIVKRVVVINTYKIININYYILRELLLDKGIDINKRLSINKVFKSKRISKFIEKSLIFWLYNRINIYFL